MQKEDHRIGIYVCNCGTYFRHRVDIERVKEITSKLKNIVIAKTHEKICGESGQEIIYNDIKKYGLTGIIIAACLAHESTFRQAIESTGLNSYLLEMVNMAELYRVHNDKEATTKKVISPIQDIVEHAA